MQLCVSNIAWAADQDQAAAEILRKHGIDAVEVAPTKYWPAPCAPSDNEIQRVRLYWTQYGLPIHAMQSLLFGMPELNLFPANQAADAVDYLKHILRIGAALGATRFVFGSPKNRDRRQLDEQTARKQAIEIFRQLAEVADELGTIFCIEPNPVVYNCNFMTNAAEALAVVGAVDHPGLGLHLDSGIMCLNGESPEVAIASAGPLLKHFHISQPQLAPVDDKGPVDHAKIAQALRNNQYDGYVSVEMRSAENPAENLVRLNAACEVLNRHYRR
jgi:D-psicose/D-tagatose/L-ribulose 3-epimerase